MTQTQEATARLWLRKWHILVSTGADTDENGEETALDVSNLHCTFEIHKARGKQGSYATCRIYNLNAKTENRLINEGDRLIIEAGYESGQYGKIFDGQIVWPSRSRENGTDYILTLMAIDGDHVLNGCFISKTVNRGLNQRKVIETVANDAEEKTPVAKISDNLSSQELPRGKVFFGSAYQYLKDACRGNAASFYIEDGQLNVTKLIDVADDEAIVLSPETGLIGSPEQIMYGVSFKCLLNPNIKLGTLVQLKDVEVNEIQASPGDNVTPIDDDWIYQAYEVVHTGDTRGETWYTQVQGISRYGKGAIPSILANAAQNGNGV
jgi:hypothetical protein